MDMATLTKLVKFYAAFTPSYTKIGYFCRGLFLSQYSKDYTGQYWLITGASGGLGAAIMKTAAMGGASVTAVSRSEEKLKRAISSLGDAAKNVRYEVTDMSLTTATAELLERLKSQNENYDVLFNNVGILLNTSAVNSEGKDTSFVTNILSHYQLTEGLITAGMVKENAAVINMTSGGMYHSPLNTANLNVTDPDLYMGKGAYAAHKRGQAVLTGYWNKKFKDKNIAFYVMHPGWAKTPGVKDALPVFYKLQNLILRTPYQGAETGFWLLATRPPTGTGPDHGVWFDHKLRSAHMFDFTREAQCTIEEFVAYLDQQLAS